LTEAGNVLQQFGRSLPASGVFGGLSSDERRILELDVRRLLEHELPWPGQRTMIDVCKI
jgi:hypothetical protein